MNRQSADNNLTNPAVADNIHIDVRRGSLCSKDFHIKGRANPRGQKQQAGDIKSMSCSRNKAIGCWLG